MQLSIEYLKSELNKINKNIKIIKSEIKNQQTFVTCFCEAHSYTWETSWQRVKRARGCPICNGSIINIAEIKKRLSQEYSNIELIDGEYKNPDSKLKFRCKSCGYEFYSTYNNIKQRNSCSECKKQIKKQNALKKFEDIKKHISDNFCNIKIIKCEYENEYSKMTCYCYEHDYTWDTIWYRLRKSKGCPICNGKLLNLDVAKGKLLEITDSIVIISDEYIDNKTDMTVMCLKDGHIWSSKFFNLANGRGCPVCGGTILHDGNRMAMNREDLIKYFKNKDLAYDTALYSKKILDLICPKCNTPKKMAAYALTTNGFSCSACGDGVSLPEKFCRSMLNELKLQFICQYSPTWAIKKRYDFYVPSLNCIIECNGEQHYSDVKKFNSTPDEIRANDRLKEKNAVENGIENYVTVDCSRSELDFLKGSFINSLSALLDIKKLDWNKIWEQSNKSILHEVCDIWNRHGDKITTKDVEDELNITKATVIKYLKIGTNLGLCVYNKKDEFAKRADKISKKVYQFTENGELIREWKSSKEIERQLGIHPSSTKYRCDRSPNPFGGFVWSYENNINIINT
jgi:predicted Zn-ribbon and HTH transcriptional regulator